MKKVPVNSLEETQTIRCSKKQDERANAHDGFYLRAWTEKLGEEIKSGPPRRRISADVQG